MQITPSSFSSGLNAVQAGQRQVDEAASDIARANVNPAPNSSAPSAAAPSRDSLSERQTPELTESLVALRIGQHQAQAGSKLVQSADEVLGTLINTRA